MKKILITVALISSCLVYANGFQEEAQKTLMPFKKNLMGKLKGGMKKGPVHAVEMCNLEAPGITKSSATKKYTVGRTSNKFRNPENAPQEWMKAVLSDYEKSNAKDEIAPRVIKLADGRQAYVEPIYTKGLCLNCHGANISNNVQEILSSKYPQDKATNYKAGEFRGLFWVTENKQ